ncbi:MAG: hypothetical protein Q9159_003711 [Coniocarpon cinnabarinum]
MGNVYPQDEYVEQLPSPPRLVVPPPQPSGQEIKLKSIPTQPHGVFQGVPIDTSYIRSEWGSWEYSDRQRAQTILPCLLLGPFGVARNPQFMQSEGISMVVAIVFTRPGQAPMSPAAIRAAQEHGLDTYIASAFSNQDLIARFPDTSRAIHKHLNARKNSDVGPGKVFVCCSSGNELSAAVVVAYLLEATELGLIPAIQLVQYQRFCINLDDAMKHTLQAYEDIVQARREVKNDPSVAHVPRRQSIMCNTPVNSSVFARRGSKRTLDDEDDHVEMDGDSTMTDGTDKAHTSRAFAPFSGG